MEESWKNIHIACLFGVLGRYVNSIRACPDVLSFQKATKLHDLLLEHLRDSPVTGFGAVELPGFGTREAPDAQQAQLSRNREIITHAAETVVFVQNSCDHVDIQN